ncbi:hypothetical protein AAFF_G00038780 [Aldrovandia affinis]|uniref:Secreted protein n=1 Tax=Aldrovandia affinis TaxID=143900 RepID=A0AAD7T5B6_9TELE|nr:hypothetical protein AAFF_G00038780 [Aldrovandia affinis]
MGSSLMTLVTCSTCWAEWTGQGGYRPETGGGGGRGRGRGGEQAGRGTNTCAVQTHAQACVDGRVGNHIHTLPASLSSPWKGTVGLHYQEHYMCKSLDPWAQTSIQRR